MRFPATDGQLQLVDVPEGEELRLSGLHSALRLCCMHTVSTSSPSVANHSVSSVSQVVQIESVIHQQRKVRV